MLIKPMRGVLSSLSLKTKLLVIMVSLCFLSIASLLFIYAQAEKDLIDEVRHHTEDISEAIQMSIEQMSQANGKVNIEKFRGLTHLRKKGIMEISVVNNGRDVIASSNPSLIGKKLFIKGESVKNFGNVTEYTTTTGGQKRYDILLPVVTGKTLLGYVHIATQFDDFASIARANHRNRLIATFAIFSIGILLAMYLSNKYTEPIQSLADAAQRVAGGDLTVRLKVEGNNEIGRLTRNFNEMVIKLDENRELEGRLKEAEHMSKIGALASGIAHEVRNPLNLINLSIDHLRATHMPVEADKRESFLSTVASIKSEIERLDGMVGSFLNFGKPLHLNLQSSGLAPILAETTHLLSDRCAEQKISVELKVGEDLPDVLVDRRQIKTCFLNLFLNAIQSMSQGGSLYVESFADGKGVTVRIEDTGCGIPPENMTKIFEPYFTTKDLGIGLGLALTKRIIEEHRGVLSVESVVNRGTTVTVNLPASGRA